MRCLCTQEYPGLLLHCTGINSAKMLLFYIAWTEGGHYSTISLDIKVWVSFTREINVLKCPLKLL
jgi:hypothetical protein